jgi:plastocyanin
MPAARRTAYLIAVAAVALTSCTNTEPAVNREPQSGSATASPVGGIAQITISAGDDYRFHPSTITVHPGRLKVVLTHTGSGAPHNWQLPGRAADDVPLTSAGQTNSVTFETPAPGKYRFICSIHVTQGQIGTLIVTKQ